jgi:hypothetical protein
VSHYLLGFPVFIREGDHENIIDQWFFVKMRMAVSEHRATTFIGTHMSPRWSSTAPIPQFASEQARYSLLVPLDYVLGTLLIDTGGP